MKVSLWTLVAALLICVTADVRAQAQSDALTGPALLNDAMILRADAHHVRTNPSSVLWIDGLHAGVVWNRGLDDGRRDRALGGFLAGSPGRLIGAGLHAGGSTYGPRIVNTSTALAFGGRTFALGWGVQHLSTRDAQGVNGRTFHTLSATSRLHPNLGLAVALSPVGQTRVGGATLERRVRSAIALRSARERVGLEVQWDAGPRDPHSLSALLHLRPRDGLRLFGRAGAAFGGGAELTTITAGLELASGPAVATAGVTGRTGQYALAGSAEISVLPGPQLRERQGELWRIDLAGDFAESPTWSFDGNSRTFTDLLHQLQTVAERRSVAGVYLDVNGLSAGFGQLFELREVLQELRDAGLAVVVYLESAALRELYLASVADAVIVSPNVSVLRTGFGTTRYYLARVLDRLGVEAQFVRIAEYKSGPERFTEEGPSPEADEQLDALYDDVWLEVRDALMAAAVVDGEALDEARFDAWWATPPLHAESLVEHGLADAVLHRDAVGEWLAERLGRAVGVTRAPAVFAERDTAWFPRQPIAVLHVSGPITAGSGRGPGGLFGEQAGSTDFTRACQEIAADRRVRGVVVRIDSPGGSATASELMWNALRQLAEAKPTVVSFGDIAASGGYYVASVGAEIFATPNTLTGSIGIYAGTFALDELFDRVGIDRAREGRGGPWDLFDGDRWDDEERGIVVRFIERAYGMFIAHVAESRGMSEEEADARGRGRIYSGSDALAANLIDSTGGFLRALDALRTAAGLRGDVTLVHYPRPTPSLSGLVRVPTVPQLEVGLALADWLELAGLDGLLPALGPLLEAGSGEPMAHLPWLEL